MAEDKSTAIAAQIGEKYKVSVLVVDTDREYYSDSSIRKTAMDGVYFVSRESLETTKRTTEHLLKIRLIRHENLREAGYAKRMDNADQKARTISDKIAEIKRDYCTMHNGQEPNLSQIATIMNELNVESPQGKHRWYAQTVKRVLSRTQPTR